MALALCLLTTSSALAQGEERLFTGAFVGVSTLSADGRSVVGDGAASVSLYKPENGLALSVFAGVHTHEYFSAQVSWMWNRNDIALTSSVAAPPGGRFYEQQRRSRQHAVVLDALVYFRRRDSAVRPYLGTGLAVLHFSSGAPSASVVAGLEPPNGTIASSRIGLRSHVGIDVRLRRGLKFRYSFSETISGNPISPSLMPPGERRLANFQNLFGVVASIPR